MPTLTPPIGTCQANVILSPPPTYPWGAGTTLQYFIDSVPITGVVNVAGANSDAFVQNKINTDPTFIAYQLAHPGTTITISTSFLALNALIQVTSSSQITVSASGTGAFPPFATLNGTSVFTCNIKKRRRSGIGFKFPETFCAPRQFKPDGTIIPCKQEVLYPTINGKVYTLISSDNVQCCYKIKR